MASKEQLDELMKVTDGYTEVPNEDMYNILMESFKRAGNGVAGTFFSNREESTSFGGVDVTDTVNHLASIMICNTIRTISSNDFDDCAKSNYDSYFEEWMTGSLGQHLLAEQVKQNHSCFNVFLDNKDEFCRSLEKLYQKEDFIKTTIEKQIVSRNVNPASMKLFLLKMLGSQNLATVIKKWREVLGSEMEMGQQVNEAESYIHGVDVVYSIRQRIKHDTGFFSGAVQSRCNHKTYYTPPSIYPVINSLSEVTYGGNVEYWLKNQADHYGLFSGNLPNNTHVLNPFGCFAADTHVLMKDGSSKAILSLTEGEKIVCAKGNTGVVSAEIIGRNIECSFVMYGFNDEKPFFLGAHPFWTQEGWKAVHPNVAKSENSSLHCGELVVGDFVKKVTNYSQNPCQIDYEWVEIKSIHFQPVPAETLICSVNTVSGGKSYHANGYVVCENYPQITLKSLKLGKQKLTSEEMILLESQLDPLKPVLIKLLGQGVVEPVLKLLTSPSMDKKPEVEKRVPATSVEMVLHGTKTSDSSRAAFQTLSFQHGELFIDNQHVPNAGIHKGNKIVWSKHNEVNDCWKHGIFTFHTNGLTGACNLIKSKDFGAKQVISSNRMISSVPPVVYECKKGVDTVTKGDEGERKEDAIDFGRIAINISLPKDSGKPEAKVSIQYPGMASPEVFDTAIAVYDPNIRKIHAQISIPLDYLESGFDQGGSKYDKYVYFDGKIDPFDRSIEGYCCKLDDTANLHRGAKYRWFGKAQSISSNIPKATEAKKMACKRSLHFDEDEDFHISANRPGLRLDKNVSRGAIAYAEKNFPDVEFH